jgi:hypothetical protein
VTAFGSSNTKTCFSGSVFVLSTPATALFVENSGTL